MRAGRLIKSLFETLHEQVPKYHPPPAACTRATCSRGDGDVQGGGRSNPQPRMGVRMTGFGVPMRIPVVLLLVKAEQLSLFGPTRTVEVKTHVRVDPKAGPVLVQQHERHVEDVSPDTLTTVHAAHRVVGMNTASLLPLDNADHRHRNAAANVVATALGGRAWRSNPSPDGKCRVHVYVLGETTYIEIWGPYSDGDVRVDWTGQFRRDPIARLKAAGLTMRNTPRGTVLVVPDAIAKAASGPPTSGVAPISVASLKSEGATDADITRLLSYTARDGVTIVGGVKIFDAARARGEIAHYRGANRPPWSNHVADAIEAALAAPAAPAAPASRTREISRPSLGRTDGYVVGATTRFERMDGGGGGDGHYWTVVRAGKRRDPDEGWECWATVRPATPEEAAPVAARLREAEEQNRRRRRLAQILADVQGRGASRVGGEYAPSPPDGATVIRDESAGTRPVIFHVQGDEITAWNPGGRDDFRTSLTSLTDPALAAELKSYAAP